LTARTIFWFVFRISSVRWSAATAYMLNKKSVIIFQSLQRNCTILPQIGPRPFLSKSFPIFLFVDNNQLNAQNFSNIFIFLSLCTCFGHYVPIIRRDPIALTQLLHLSFRFSCVPCEHYSASSWLLSTSLRKMHGLQNFK
jgi:hypothetical protein